MCKEKVPGEDGIPEEVYQPGEDGISMPKLEEGEIFLFSEGDNLIDTKTK